MIKPGPNATTENGIYTGDCRDLAPQIQADTARLILTDPPWGTGYDYHNDNFTDDPDTADQLTSWAVNQSNRLLEPGYFAFIYQPSKRLYHTWQLFPPETRLFTSCKNFVQIKSIPVEYATDSIIFWQKPGSFPHKGMARDWHRANTADTAHRRKTHFRCSPRPPDTVAYIIDQMTAPGDLVVDFFIADQARQELHTNAHPA